MRYTGGLAKKERATIFALFSHSKRLSFAQIAKESNLRSNLLAYHLRKMVDEGLLVKTGSSYQVSATSETFLPRMAHVTGTEIGPLPVVLVAGIRANKIFLIKRDQRPYQNWWGLPGGKIHSHERIGDAALRKLVEEGAIGRKPVVRAVFHEHVRDVDGIIKHGFLLFFVTCELVSRPNKKSCMLANIKRKVPLRNIIPSDEWLLSHKLHSRSVVTHATMEERDDNLVLQIGQ